MNIPTVPTRRANTGFTLIELLVVIAIIAILAAILFPVFAQARAKARQTACLSNMKQIGLSMMQYTQDYDETLPVNNRTFQGGSAGFGNTYTLITWLGLINQYSKSTGIFICPDAPKSDETSCFDNTVLPGPGGTNPVFCVGGQLAAATGQAIKIPIRNIGGNEWIFNRAGVLTAETATPANLPQPVALADIRNVASTPAVADSLFLLWDTPDRIAAASYQGNPEWFRNYTPGVQSNDPKNARHSGGSTVLYVDGHAKWSAQGALRIDPSRSAQPSAWNQYRLPVVPVTTVRGGTNYPADDRLQ